MASGQEMDATEEVPIAVHEGDNAAVAAAAADIDLNLEDFMDDMEINGSEADLEADAEYEDEVGSDEGVSNETENIAVKPQTQLTEQNILIGVQQCRIQNLEADFVKLQALIEQLTREQSELPMPLTAMLHLLLHLLLYLLLLEHVLSLLLQLQMPLAPALRPCLVLSMARPTSRLGFPLRRTLSAAAPPAVPPPSGARAEPPAAAANAFGSCTSALPRFVHGKTDVETWLSIAEDFMSILNVCSEARVVAASLALDDTASKLVSANKRHAEANGHPFG
ncbi:unnamed protein product [Closterium sp. NIES-54]